MSQDVESFCNTLCSHDPKAKSEKAGICEGVSSTAIWYKINYVDVLRQSQYFSVIFGQHIMLAAKSILHVDIY